MPKPKKTVRIPPISAEDALKLQKIIEEATRKFDGQPASRRRMSS